MGILVHGSINVDSVWRVDRLPRAGETVMAGALARFPGGKGANQAVAASGLGATVALSGAVGADENGAFMLERLAAAGVDISAVFEHDHLPTGSAAIAVDPDGENIIIVSPGANACLTATRRNEAFEIVLAQLETPSDGVAQALRTATKIAILNAAPAVADGASLFPLCDVIVVNQTELAFYAGETANGVIAAARGLLCRDDQTVIVTLGSAGALAVTGESAFEAPGHKVDAIDATGAGDCFCGALAYALDSSMPLREALTLANGAAALSATRHGAAASMPTISELNAFLCHPGRPDL